MERTTDDDCKIKDIEKLDLLNLIDAASLNEDCSKLAADIFRTKYAEKQFKIEKNKNPSPWNDDGSVVLISNLQVATNMIKLFGHLITKLSLQINYDGTLCTPVQIVDTVILLGEINERCRESLVEVELHYSGCEVNNIFQQIIGPFEHVEILSLHLFNMIVQTADQQAQLNKIFPNVRHLNIDFHQIRDSAFIDCEFAKLKELGIADGLIYESNESILIDLLKKNPQITYISVIRPTLKVLRLINKYLVHLQDLHILMENQEEFSFRKITFSSVQRLNLWLSTGKCYPPKKIAFGSALHDIALVCASGDMSDNYLNFLLKYPKIKKLSAGQALNNAHVTKLIDKFPKLSDAFFDFTNDVSAATVVEFITKSPSLNRMIFLLTSAENFEPFENQLKFELGTDFTIQSENMGSSLSKRFSIERKIPILSESNEDADSDACQCHSVIRNTIAIFAAGYAARLVFFWRCNKSYYSIL